MFRRAIPITDGVFQVKAIGARVTVLTEGGKVLLVDAGLRGSGSTITRGLRAAGLSPDRIGRVVVTHAHPDHSGGLGELTEGRKIAVAAHPLEADIIDGTVAAPNPLQCRMLAWMARPPLTKLMGNPVHVDDRIEDGDVLPFGTEVRVVHLPGHTPGSVGLHLPEKRAVIVGDALHSTSSVGGYTHQPQESPSSQERRCGRWRSSSTWSSTSSASATSRPCGGSPAKRLEGLSSGTPPDQRGLQWLSELTCWNATFAPVRTTSARYTVRLGGS